MLLLSTCRLIRLSMNFVTLTEKKGNHYGYCKHKISYCVIFINSPGGQRDNSVTEKILFNSFIYSQARMITFSKEREYHTLVNNRSYVINHCNSFRI